MCLFVAFLYFIKFIIFDFDFSLIQKSVSLLESVKSRVWHACVLICLTCLHACVLTCVACSGAYVLVCLACIRAGVLKCSSS